jgi:hypothetical protein
MFVTVAALADNIPLASTVRLLPTITPPNVVVVAGTDDPLTPEGP